MLVVETIAKIRRAYFIQGKSIKQICRRSAWWTFCIAVHQTSSSRLPQ